jgi:hypothetical protein
VTQKMFGGHARLVTGYADEERSRSNTFREVLCNHRPWTNGPTVVLVEADFDWRRTIDDATLAEIIGTAQFLDREQCLCRVPTTAPESTVRSAGCSTRDTGRCRTRCTPSMSARAPSSVRCNSARSVVS